MYEIVVIGAGFSGAVTAMHLLKTCKRNTRITLINRSGSMAKGLAYGTNSPLHLLNVPAGNMSALAQQPNDFLDFCKSRLPEAGPGTFVTRQIYGEYLATRLNEAEHNPAPGVLLRRISAEVCGLYPTHEGAQLALNSGEQINARQVVLAFGHFAPNDPYGMATARETGRYQADPWGPATALDCSLDAPVLLVGAGLTALDVSLGLLQHGQRGTIHMLSRRGLPLLTHRTQRGDMPLPTHFMEELLDGPAQIRHYLCAIRQQIRHCELSGHDWRDVMAALRPITPALWQRLPLAERARFLRHVQPYWDVHRHRVAPQSHQRFTAARAQGQITQAAGRISKITPTADGLLIDIQLRGTQAIKQIEVARVINCTGPNGNLSHVRDPLITQLQSLGLIQLDPLGLGLRVDDRYAVYCANNTPLSWLSYVGPMLKADHWEAVAVPELRVHAEGVAKKLAQASQSHRPD